VDPDAEQPYRSHPTGLRDLGESEQLALCALLRLLIRLDGQFSDAEQEALQEIALDFGERRFWQVMEDAASKAPDDESVRALALGITRPGVRELVYGVILHVAQSDVAQGRELGLLDWLRSEWKLEDDTSPYRSA
jgi:hypothetical protein